MRGTPSSALKIALSNGVQSTISSAPSVGTPVRRVSFNSNTATTGNYWYGIAVRFTSP